MSDNPSALPARGPRTGAACLLLVMMAVLASAAHAFAQPSTPPLTEGTLKLVWTVPTDRFGISEVQFQEEVQDDGYAREIQGRSLEGAADIDCAAGQFRLIRMVIYPLAKRTGEPVMRIGARPEWRRAELGTTMARVVSAACGGSHRPRAAQTELTAVVDATPRPTAAKPSAASTASTEWMATQRPIAEPPPEPAPPPAKPLPPPAAQPVSAPGPTPPPAPASSGPFYVQLASERSAELAEQAWRGAQISNPSQLSDLHEKTETQRVKGALYHRVLVGGFASGEEAGRLCKALARGPATCWVRRLSPGE